MSQPLDSLALISTMEPFLRHSVDDALSVYHRIFIRIESLNEKSRCVGRAISEWAKMHSLNNAEVCELCHDLQALQRTWAPWKIINDGLSDCFQFLPEEELPIPYAREIVNRPAQARIGSPPYGNIWKPSPKVAFTSNQMPDEVLWEGSPFGSLPFFPRARYQITPKRVSASIGHFVPSNSDIRVSDIRQVTVKQRNLLFGTADVVLHVGAGGGITFEQITNGEHVRELIRKLQCEQPIT